MWKLCFEKKITCLLYKLIISSSMNNLLLSSWYIALGDRLSSLSVCQEEESKQAEGHHGDRGQALASWHSATSLWSWQGCCQERYNTCYYPETLYRELCCCDQFNKLQKYTKYNLHKPIFLVKKKCTKIRLLLLIMLVEKVLKWGPFLKLCKLCIIYIV